MTDSRRFSLLQQRTALLKLAHSIDYLRTPEGLQFVEQVECFLVPRALAETRKFGLGTGWLEASEVVNTALIRLTEENGRVAQYAAQANEEPWGYLAICITGWVRDQIGLRANPIDEQYSVSLANRHDEQSLTSLEDVVSLTFRALCPFAQPAQRPALRRLLTWLAENPPQRLSYENHDCLAASIHFPEFTYAQISAVMNAVWGGRPKRRETSIFAAFLLDSSFRPSDSPSHARALARFRRAFTKQCAPLIVTNQVAA